MRWLFAFLVSFNVYAKLNVVATTPDLAWLIRKVGGTHVTVDSLLNGTEDPHYVDAMPHWIVKVAKADMFCVVGMALEVGWAPKVLSRSGNAKVQPGRKGYCDVGKSVSALDAVKGKIDRSMGDLHPEGNPHYNLGPSFYLQAARGVSEKLLVADPKNSGAYLANLQALEKELMVLKKRVQGKLAPLKGAKVMSYHKEFSYFFQDFGLIAAGEIEETPGVPPSAGRIARVALAAKRRGVRLVVHSHLNPKAVVARFSEISGVPSQGLFVSIQKEGKPGDYPALIEGIAEKILRAVKK